MLCCAAVVLYLLNSVFFIVANWNGCQRLQSRSCLPLWHGQPRWCASIRGYPWGGFVRRPSSRRIVCLTNVSIVYFWCVYIYILCRLQRLFICEATEKNVWHCWMNCFRLIVRASASCSIAISLIDLLFSCREYSNTHLVCVLVFFSPAVWTWFAMRIVIVTNVFHFGLLASSS
jgi:hypothetical protein